MKDVWSTSQASQLHRKPEKRRAKIPAWATFLVLTVIVVTAVCVSIEAYDHHSKVLDATAEMQQAIEQAQALAEAVDELYTESGGDELISGLSTNDIKTLQALLEEIQSTPREAYADEVQEELDITGHQKLLATMELRLEEAQEKLAVLKMESAVRQAQALSAEVDELYTEAGGDFISSGWTVAEIDVLRNRLSEIQKEPEEKYFQAVAGILSITDHRSRLEEMEQRMEAAKEKRMAADEINALFEAEVIGNMPPDSLTELHLAPGTDDADIQSLLDKYGDNNRADAYWNTVIYVLERASYELAQPEA